ncbi:hypothetical protein RB619_08170 [Flavobacterium sp. LHD-80]|uniref:Ig-like domain-containing protein n=1 Tax=Flavobacterium sp. LHD-80 TaxID=3071411 RepID=UPI0027E00A4D|nr:hypothetical protein [Flavobacterium sp. LHD-80]MDQ6470614.1 hypothetical protein [Flavobacterium sp. LHD-80]
MVNKINIGRKKVIKLLMMHIMMLIFSNGVRAQFTYKDDFKNSTAPDLILGGPGGASGQAYLTSGINDPKGAGWLRLTKAITSQRGYAYVNKSFPSTLGVLLDFEYKMWRDASDSGFNGADGIGVFLFDAQEVAANGFRLGGYGGSLGYAPHQQNGTPLGLRGGYIGIGLDAYGNFSQPTDGPKTGGPGIRPNSIALRGPTDDVTISNSNVFLAGRTLLSAQDIRDITEVGDPATDAVDYNTITSQRPTDDLFYRRVQIEIIPTLTGGVYDIIVRWKTTLDGDFQEIFRYTTTEIPPALLSVGFAGSTGSGFNYHELRNILMTTPGNLRISKHASKDYLRAITGSGFNEITYYIEVVNDTDAALSSINFEDKITDSQGNIINPSMFTITSITHSGFLSGTVLPTTSSINEFSGSLNLAANSTGKIMVTGQLSVNQIPIGNVLINTTTVNPQDITDEDLTNNTSSVTTPVLAEQVDLILVASSQNQCVDGSNSFDLKLANIGTQDAVYRRIGTTGQRMVITKVIESGFTYNDSATPGGFDSGSGTVARWTRFVQTNTPAAGQTTYNYIARYPIANTDQILKGFGTVYEPDYPIRYTITPPAGTNSYTDVSTVAYRAACSGAGSANCYTGNNIEILTPTDNTANNTVSTTLKLTPIAPTVVSPIEYCMNDTAIALSATADTGNSLRWYTNIGGIASDDAFIPLTNVSGVYTYYVSQVNGSCEGPMAEISVTILPTPVSGTISGPQTVCSGISPGLISSSADGTGTGTITYRWESSIDNAATWQTIAGASIATYQPPPQTKTTQYRRITIASTTAGTICESVPTTPAIITTKDCKVVSNPMIRQRVK